MHVLQVATRTARTLSVPFTYRRVATRPRRRARVRPPPLFADSHPPEPFGTGYRVVSIVRGDLFAARWGEINIPIVVSVSSTREKDGFLWMRRVVLGYCPDGLSLVWKPAGRVHRRVRRTSIQVAALAIRIAR